MEYKNSFLNTKLTKLYEADCLVGNWVEDRSVKDAANEEAQKEYCSAHIETENSSSYKPYNNMQETNNYNFILTHRNKKKGILSRVKFCDSDSDAFHNNFTRSSDLFYTFFPRTYCDTLPIYNKETKTFDPRPDLLNSYGNLTNFGVKKYYEYKKYIDKRVSGLSETRESYDCYENKYYKPHVQIKGPKPTIKLAFENYVT